MRQVLEKVLGRVALVVLMAILAAPVLCLGFLVLNLFYGYDIANFLDQQKQKALAVDEPALARQGIPLVEAVYRYHHRVGLWPRDLDELIPDYLTAEQLAGWKYDWEPTGYWTLTNYKGFPVSAVRFKHLTSAKGTWQSYWGDGEDDLDIRQPLSEESPVPPKEREGRLLRELSRRIAAYPKEIVHFQGAVSYCAEVKAWPVAERVCLECLDRHPDHWWPNLMRAYIGMKLGVTEDAERELVAWVEKEPCFARYFFVAYFQELSSQQEKACDTLLRAAEFPLKSPDVFSDKTSEKLGKREEWFGWEAVLMALPMKKYDVIFAICDRWEQFIAKEKSYGDRSFHALRAACYLRLGKVEKASEELRLATEAKQERRLAADNLDQLEKAIKDKDTSFTYDPGFVPEPLELLKVYK